MANITNAAIVKFCDEKIRPAADRAAQLYNFARIVVDEWNALGGAAVVPNTTTDIVVDGSTGDGRPGPLTGRKVNDIIARLTEFVTDYEATSKTKLNTILSVSVNTNR